jgi:hypothetical protein
VHRFVKPVVAEFAGRAAAEVVTFRRQVWSVFERREAIVSAAKAQPTPAISRRSGRNRVITVPARAPPRNVVGVVILELSAQGEDP